MSDYAPVPIQPNLPGVTAVLLHHRHNSGGACAACEIVRLRGVAADSLVTDHKLAAAESALAALREEVEERKRAWHSVCVMLGWGNDPPRKSIEDNLRANRARLERSEADLSRATSALATLRAGVEGLVRDWESRLQYSSEPEKRVANSCIRETRALLGGGR